MSWKSIWAVVAGVLVIIVVTTLVDALLHVAGGRLYEMQTGKR